MKKKILISLFIMIIVLNIAFIQKVFAEESTCKIDTKISSENLASGEELSITVSTKDVKEGIVGIGFTVNYDSDIFEYQSAEAASGWEIQSELENLFTLFTKEYEPNTQDGRIVTIKLKAKEDVSGVNEKISLKDIEITKADSSVEDFEEVNAGNTSIQKIANVVDNTKNNTSNNNETKNKVTNTAEVQDITGNTEEPAKTTNIKRSTLIMVIVVSIVIVALIMGVIFFAIHKVNKKEDEI